MISRKKALGALGSLAVAGSMFLAPIATQANAADNDPAHHSTNVGDGDPAHHQPNLVCPTSGNSPCVLVAIAGFDLAGNRLGGGGGGTATPNQGDTDPAHHSTNVNDPDPAHHQPVLTNVGGTYELVAIPGFDLNGNRV